MTMNVTRKEAIKTLRELRRETNDSWYEEVFNMAINALSEPSGDLISRVDAIKAVWNAYADAINFGDSGEEIASDIDIILSALPSSEADWIPVSERLPSEDGCYLVSTTGTNNDIIDIAYYTEEIWHKASRIKAWMPLPKPYREDGEE